MPAHAFLRLRIEFHQETRFPRDNRPNRRSIAIKHAITGQRRDFLPGQQGTREIQGIDRADRDETAVGGPVARRA